MDDKNRVGRAKAGENNRDPISGYIRYNVDSLGAS